MKGFAAVPAAFLLLAASASTARAQQERIDSFVSDIVVRADASITVTETIAVTSTGDAIKRGIVREFPTTYQDRNGNTVRVGFQVVAVKRDLRREPYHTERSSNGQKVYIGQKDVLIDPGPHVFEITYRTDRQLGFFDKFDELYWNVTGNGWTLAMEHVEARISLPTGARLLQRAAYTGVRGAQGQDFAFREDGTSALIFTTTRRLAPGEGLTIAVAWPKGLVREPTTSDRIATALSDNPALAPALWGLFLVLGYYLFVWFLVGRDPAKGIIVPLFAPPEGLSPAACRFVERMGFDQKALAASVLNLAVSGALKIEEKNDAKVTLHRRERGTEGGTEENLSPLERELAQTLFATKQQVTLENREHNLIASATKILKRGLERDYAKRTFRTNRKYFLPGVVVSLGSLVWVATASGQTSQGAFIVVWLTAWTVACAALGHAVVSGWRSVFEVRRRAGKAVQAFFVTAFALPFFAGEIFGLSFLVGHSAPAVVVTAALLLLNPIFYWLLGAPTFFGRRLMDQIEGFKLYLSVAEKERLATLYPPEKTPALFERFLPYALALGVDQQWSEQFADVLAEAGQGGGTYAPSWYVGHSPHGLGTAAFGSHLADSLSSAISSSSSAPGSSSGSSGGGSSGGGGGGGGGGGW